MTEVTNITIRKITKSDFPSLIDLFKEFATFEKQPEKMINSVELMQRDKNLVNGYVLETDDKKIVGYTTYFFAYFTWVGKSLYMDDLYVKPEFRGKGLGTQLINKVIDFAKEENCNRLRWQVSDWNMPAKGFYESLGAKISGVEQNCDLVLI